MSFSEAKWLLEQIKSSLNNNSSGFQQVIKEQIELLNLPYNFYLGSAVVYNNEIHILGSDISGNYTNHYKYNGSSWTSVSTLPYRFYGGSAVVYNNEIHILGSSSDYTKHYKYNGSSWTSVSTLPYYFYNGSAVVYNNEIHILGSGISGNRTNHYIYNGSSWINNISYKQYLSPNDIYIKTYDGYSLDTFKNINSGSTIEQDSSDNSLYKVTLSNNTINIPEQALLTILR